MREDVPSTPGEAELEQMLFDAVPELGCHPHELGELLTAREITVLWQHLSNDNDPFDVAMNFRSKEGGVLYRTSATKTYNQLVSWSLATIQGKKPGKEMSVVPYATNRDARSRWAVMDFDAHSGEITRAYKFARDAYRHFQSRSVSGVIVFLEHTGTGGWHLWLVSLDFHPCSWWAFLLKEAATTISAPVEAGVCEIFPHE